MPGPHAVGQSGQLGSQRGPAAASSSRADCAGVIGIGSVITSSSLGVTGPGRARNLARRRSTSSRPGSEAARRGACRRAPPPRSRSDGRSEARPSATPRAPLNASPAAVVSTAVTRERRARARARVRPRSQRAGLAERDHGVPAPRARTAAASAARRQVRHGTPRQPLGLALVRGHVVGERQEVEPARRAAAPGSGSCARRDAARELERRGARSPAAPPASTRRPRPTRSPPSRRSTSAAVSARLAPGATAIWLRPLGVDHDQRGAGGRPGPLVTSAVDADALGGQRRRAPRGPTASSPTQPTSRTSAPSRRAATAWLAPLPPCRRAACRR